MNDEVGDKVFYEIGEFIENYLLKINTNAAIKNAYEESVR
jgi:hypothetical protein